MRVRTGVSSFDALVGGGLPHGSCLLFRGPPGKDTDAFSREFLAEGLRSGEAAVVVVSSSPPEQFVESLASVGPEVQRAIADARLKIVDWYSCHQDNIASVEERENILRVPLDPTEVVAALGKALQSFAPKVPRRAVLEFHSPAVRALDPAAVYALVQNCRAKLTDPQTTAVLLLGTGLHDPKAGREDQQPPPAVIDVELVSAGGFFVHQFGVPSLEALRPGVLPKTPDRPADERVARGLADPTTPEFRVANAPRQPGTPATVASPADERLPDSQRAAPRESGRADEPDARQPQAQQGVPSPAQADEAGKGQAVSEKETRSKVCPRCGTNLREADNVCFGCGADIPNWKGIRTKSLIERLEVRLLRDPADSDALFVKGTAFAAMERWEEAAQALNELAKVEPSYPGVWFLKAEIYERMGKPKMARSCRERALALSGKEKVADVERLPEPRSTVAAPQGSRGSAPDNVHASVGLINGLLHEKRFRDLAPRKGRTNGREGVDGLINGLRGARARLADGLTNGNGFTNGLGGVRFSREMRIRRWKQYVVPGVATLLLMTPLLAGTATLSPYAIAIDGGFSDWPSGSFVSVPPSLQTARNVDLVGFAVADNVDFLAFYFQVNGTALAGGGFPPTMDTVRAFIDVDRNAATGYRIDGLGADGLVEVSGWGGHANTSAFWGWDESRTASDWNGWLRKASIPAAVSGSKIEAEVDWKSIAPEKRAMDVMFHAQAFDGAEDIAEYTVSTSGGSLRVSETPVVSDVITGPGSPLLRLDLRAAVKGVSYDSLAVRMIGTAEPSAVSNLHLVDKSGSMLAESIPVSQRVSFQFSPRTLAVGQSDQLFVLASSSLASGATLGARIDDPRDIGAGRAAVTIARVPGLRAVGYLGSVPTAPVVDGGFAEWIALTPDPTNEAEVRGNANIDVQDQGRLNDGASLFFYADVAGHLLAGTRVPEHPHEIPAAGPPSTIDTDRDTVPDTADPWPIDFNNDGTSDSLTNGDYDGDGITDYGFLGGTDSWLNTTFPATFPVPYAGRSVSVYIGPTTRPVVEGEDVLRVFLDLDNSTWSGFAIGGLGADRMVEVRGKDGEATQSVVLAFAGSYPGDWRWDPVSSATIASGYRAIEMSVGFNASAVYVEIGDFWGGVDSIAPFSGTRGSGGADRLPGPSNSFAVAPARRPMDASWRQAGSGTRGSVLIDGGSAARSTLYNHQRKVVRAGDTPGGPCDATNSDGCWYAVFYDQLSEGTTDTAASTETITTGSKVAGVFPADIQTANNVYIQYRESADLKAAIGYRSNTGTNLVSSPKTRTWDGSTWDAETEQSTASSPIRAVRVAWSPTAFDTRIIVTQSDDGFLDAYVCTPACTVTNDIGQVWSTAPANAERRFDVAYESLSGEALLVYGVLSTSTTQDLAYKVFSGGSWGAEQYVDDTTAATDIQYTWVNLASKKGSDQIALGATDLTNSDMNAWIWGGSAWGSQTEVTTSADSPTMNTNGVAWESSSGHLLAVSGASNGDFAWKEYTTSWSGGAIFTCGDNAVQWLSLKSDPVSTSNQIVAAHTESSPILSTCIWSGTAWSNWVTQDSGIDTSTTQVFDFAWEDAGGKGLLVYGTTGGQITYRTFTAPNTWGAATNVAMGANTHAWVQLRTNTSPGTGAMKILGVVMETTALDLGAIRWDGTTFTVDGASTFTADVGTTTYESFELEYAAFIDDQLLVRYDWTGIPAGDSYTLKVKGYRQDENVNVQVLTPPATWTTRITISATTNTLYTSPLTASEYNGGAPSIRFVDASGTVGIQSDLFVDWAVVTSNSFWDRTVIMRSSDTSGSAWGSQITLASGRTGDSALLLARDSSEPSIAIDSGGFVHVVWVSASAAGNQQTMNLVRYTRTTIAYPTQSELASAPNWEAVTNVDDTLPGYMPTVSTDTNNAPHVAWSGSKTSGTVYYKNKVGGTWKPTVSWGTTSTGLSVDVSPQNNFVSLTRLNALGFTSDAETAYRSNTGANTVNSPKTRTWDGSAWGSETEQATAGSPIRAARMAFSPLTSNERIIVTLSDDGWLDAYVCTTTCTVTNNIGQVWSTAPTTPQKRFDIAYEQTSGEGLLVYGVLSADTTRDIAYRTFVGGTWSSEQYLDDTGHATDIQYSLIELASKTGSNQVGLIGADLTNGHANAWIWDGSAFGSNTEVTTSMPTPDRGQVAIAWESSSGDLLAVAGVSGDPRISYKQYTTSWSAANTFDCGNIAPLHFLSLKPNSLSSANDMILATVDNGFDLTTCYWSGTGWSSLNTHDTAIDSITTRSCDFAWESAGSKGLLVWGTTAGQITYRTFTAPNTFGTITNVGMGTNTHAWVQLRTNPNPATGATKILGAVMENTALDLGGVKWDGTTFAVIGASTFTADVGTTTYDSFDLEFEKTSDAVDVEYTVCKNLAASNCDAAAEFTKADGTAGADTVATAVETASYPSLATTYEANGDLWVAYAKDISVSQRAIYARSLDYPSATWGAAETVDSQSGTLFTRPSIGIDRNNNAHALYVATSGPQLYYNQRTGGSWGSPQAVDTASDNPTLMVRAPNDATYGTPTAGLYWKTTTSETYFYIPEFADVVVPILGLLVLCVLGRGASRRGIRRLGSPSGARAERQAARAGDARS